MRAILFTAAFICSSLLASAQYSQLKGLAIMATREMRVENGEIKTNTTDQCYTFSFKDKILCHNIYKDGLITAAPFYRLGEALVDSGIETVYTVEATSGLSGNIYTYTITINKSGKLVSMTRTRPDGTSKETFTGAFVTARTILH